MRKIFLLSALLLLALAAGCVNYDERIELNPDGSGVVRLHLAVSEQAIGMAGLPRPTKEDEMLPAPAAEMTADFEKQGFKVRSLRAESVGGLRHFYIVLEFKSLADVEKSDIFKDRHPVFAKEDGKLVFRQTVAVNEKTLADRAGGGSGPMMRPPKVIDYKDNPPRPGEKRAEPKPAPPDAKSEPPKKEEYVSIIKQMEMRFGRERVLQMFEAYSISFSVQLAGGALLKTNGYNHRDSVAIWDTPLAKLIEKWPTIPMEATFALNAAPAPEKPATEAKKP